MCETRDDTNTHEKGERREKYPKKKRDEKEEEEEKLKSTTISTTTAWLPVGGLGVIVKSQSKENGGVHLASDGVVVRYSYTHTRPLHFILVQLPTCPAAYY
ncbi:hypothetical protein OUZ56_030504 [Daphnia magna]|uniref:Uncharacterized protein n=1 Tax=Daphnia magna TaxID=35525 RepID=A0ABQ9ZRI0_9CRUS|nr:hypothetical protein OUZ56_030504 [Daphnia magna]